MSDEQPTADPVKTHVVVHHKHGSPLIGCRFDSTGKYVFYSAQDYKVWRWDWAADAKVELDGHESWVRGMAVDASGQTLVTGGYEGKLVWWPAADDKPAPLRTIKAHDGWVRAVAISPDGSLLASTGNDNLVKLWSMADGAPVREMKGHEAHVYNAAFHPDGKHLVTGDLMGNLIQWEVETGAKVRDLKAESLHKYDKTFRADIGGPRVLVFSNDGALLACGGITEVSNAFAGIGNPAIDLLDWESGKRKTQHLSEKKVRGCIWGAAIHPQGFTIGASGGGGGGFLLFWKFDQQHEFHQFKLPNTARDMDLSSDGLHLAVAHYDGVRICKMAEKV